MGATTDYPGLRSQPGGDVRPGPVFRTIRRALRAQFGRPTGVIGRLVGCIMATDRSNNERIRWTLGLLDIKPADRILEIGFGPGVAIALASERARSGVVIGVDHSPVMVRQAARRNAAGVREGRVALWQGTASDLPRFDQPVDKIFTINSIHFWPEPVGCLERLRRHLKPGGVIAVTLQPRSRRATEATSTVLAEELIQNLERAGFSDCRVVTRPARPAPVVCALGTNLGVDDD